MQGQDMFIYTPGAWNGNPTLKARLFVDGVDTVDAVGGMLIWDEWRGKQCGVREEANNAAGGPVYALSQEVLAPLKKTPEQKLVELFAEKRLGYVIDPRDKATMLQAGNVPVTADSQSVQVVNIKLKSSATAIAFSNTNVAAQAVWAANDLVADGVDDNYAFPSGGTVVQPDFGNLAGFVGSILITPGALPPTTQAFWTVGFGGTVTNNRLRVWASPNGSIGFSVHDGVARRDFSTPAGVLVQDKKTLITLFVDYQTKVAKGFVDGVERASFTLLNTTDIVNVDSNRMTLFRNHGSGEIAKAKLHRAAYLHDRTDDAGRITIENWVKEFA
jgi:hypothetical protein